MFRVITCQSSPGDGGSWTCGAGFAPPAPQWHPAIVIRGCGLNHKIRARVIRVCGLNHKVHESN